MTFEIRHIDDVIRIAAAGGGFKMDGKLKHTDDLVRIASAARNGGARITFTGISKIRDINDLVRIASAGEGAVVFED